MDDRKVVNTQRLKSIETLSQAQNSYLLTPAPDSIDGVLLDTGLATMGGAPEPSIPVSAKTIGRMSARRADKRKPSRRVRGILVYCIAALNAIDNEDHDANEALGNAVDSSLDPPNYAASMSLTEAEHWRIVIKAN
jgi:hypothetical protein